MLGKIKSPLWILAFLYFAIIILALVFGTLLIWFMSNISHQVQQRQANLKSEHCQIYLEFSKYGFYEKCLADAR